MKVDDPLHQLLPSLCYHNKDGREDGREDEHVALEMYFTSDHYL